MERFYLLTSSMYRILVVSVFVYFHYQIHQDISTNTLVMYLLFGLYALFFSLMRTSKWVAYMELAAIFSLIHVYGENSLYYLILMPIVSFASSRATKVDVVLFSLMVSGFVYLSLSHFWFFVFSLIGTMSALATFHSKFHHLELIEKRLHSEKETAQEVKKNLADREAELENVLKMFMKSKELNEIAQEDQLLKVLTESAQEFFNAHYACLYLEVEGMLEKWTESGRNEKFNAPNALNQREAETDIIKGDMLQVVIYLQNKLWGVLRVYGKTSLLGTNSQRVFSPFSEMDHELLLTYVDQVMIKMKEVKLSEKNEFLANNDYLTGVPNRRYFIERFEQFSAIAARGGEFSLLLMDIDNFKSFNDRFGHDTGDTVLKIVGETLSEAIRDKYDVVGRIGGEEFGILLLNPDNQSFLIADRIRKMISLIPAIDQITISVGIAYYGIDGTTWEELYNNADQALYYAKENGRNQVIEYRQLH